MSNSMGGAEFVVRADTAQFLSGMKAAEVAGASTARAITGSMAQAETATQRFTVGLPPMTAGLNRAASEAQKFTVALPAMAAGLNQAATAAQRFTVALPSMPSMPAHLAKVEPAARNAAQGLLLLSYAADDAAYGFGAVVNNIPGIVMGLGGSAGIAGAVAVAGVAIRTLINHWGELTDQFNSFTTDKPVAELERLRKKNEEVAESYERVKGAKTKAEKEEQSEREEAIIEGPIGDVRGKVIAQLLADKQVLPDRPEQAGGGEGDVGPSFVRPKSAAQARQEKAEEMADRILGGGAKPGAEQNILNNSLAASRAKLKAEKDKPADDREDRELRKQDIQNQNESQAHRLKIEQKTAKENKDAKKKQDHEDAAELKQWRHEIETIEKDNFNESKRKRIESLEDQRTAIQRQLQIDEEKIWKQGHGQRPGQILGSTKDALDMYQKAGQGGSAADLAKKSHELQQAANKKLQVIADALTKQQRRKPLIVEQ
jgi:hypothetical protein